MTGKELLIYAAEFTRRYRAATDIYAREAACLRCQFAHHLLPLREGDRVAGRAVRLPLGVRPQCHGGVGYYLHEPSWLAAVEDGRLTGDPTVSKYRPAVPRRRPAAGATARKPQNA